MTVAVSVVAYVLIAAALDWRMTRAWPLSPYGEAPE